MANTTPSPQTPRSRKPNASNLSNHQSPSANSQWPKGPCHFTDLSAGQNPPRCGCQRFLIDGDVRVNDGEDGSVRNPRCGCGHRANFHEPSLPWTAAGFMPNNHILDSSDRVAPLTSTVRPVFLQVVQNPTHQGKSSGSYIKLDSGPVPRPQSPPECVTEDSDQVRHLQSRTSSRSGTRSGNTSILQPIPPQCRMSCQDGQVFDQGDPTTPLGGELLSVVHTSNDESGRPSAVETSNSGLGIASPRGNPLTDALMDALVQDDLDHMTGNRGNSSGQRTQPPALRSGFSRRRRSPGDPSGPALHLAGGSPDRHGIDPRTRLLQTSKLPVPAMAPLMYQGNSADYGIPESVFLSTTEPATSPSQRGTPDLRALSEFDVTYREYQTLTGKIRQGASRDPRREGSRQDNSENGKGPQTPVGFSNASPPKRVYVSDDICRSMQQLMRCLDTLTPKLAAIPGLVTAFRVIRRRLEALENASVSNTPIEGVSEDIDMLDGRLTEVAQKVEDLENKLHAAEDESLISSSRRRGVDETAATLSFTSHASSLRSASSPAVMENAEMERRIVELTSKLSEMELLLPPSVQRPWQIEVIMIPWGPELCGIWAMSDSSADGRSGTGEWTQTQGRRSVPLSRTNSFREPEKYESVWDGPSIQEWAQGAANWMAPKACGMKSKVYKRLKSRGLIRDVEVIGGSARDVEGAIMTEFGDVIRVLNDDAASMSRSISRSQTSDIPDEETVLGLQAPYIPLRKIHKNSRLRFLTKNEMVSSALWTVEFLKSSVIMKGREVLFVTHRDGYTQPPGNGGSEWTWQRLRELPRVDLANSTAEEGSNTVREGDAREACWEWDYKLDPRNSASASFASEASRAPVLSIRNRQSSNQPVKEERSGTPEQSTFPETMPAEGNLPVSPMSNYPPELRTQNQEPSSMRQAADVSINARTSQSKRREASRASVSTARPIAKRRKLPPSLRHEEVSSNHGAICNATPRESQPASPFFSAFEESRSQAIGGGNASSRKGETQFAYATPYSGPVAMERRGRRLVKREVDVEENEGGGDEYGGTHESDWEGLEHDEEEEERDEDDEDDDDDDNDDDEEDDSESSSSEEEGGGGEDDDDEDEDEEELTAQ